MKQIHFYYLSEKGTGKCPEWKKHKDWIQSKKVIKTFSIRLFLLLRIWRDTKILSSIPKTGKRLKNSNIKFLLGKLKPFHIVGNFPDTFWKIERKINMKIRIYARSSKVMYLFYLNTILNMKPQSREKQNFQNSPWIFN